MCHETRAERKTNTLTIGPAKHIYMYDNDVYFFILNEYIRTNDLQYLKIPLPEQILMNS